MWIDMNTTMNMFMMIVSDTFMIVSLYDIVWYSMILYGIIRDHSCDYKKKMTCLGLAAEFWGKIRRTKVLCMGWCSCHFKTVSTAKFQKSKQIKSDVQNWEFGLTTNLLQQLYQSQVRLNHSPQCLLPNVGVLVDLVCAEMPSRLSTNLEIWSTTGVIWSHTLWFSIA